MWSPSPHRPLAQRFPIEPQRLGIRHGINGLLDRLRYVRGMGLDALVSRAIPEFCFAQFVSQGGVAPAFLLSDYSINRRRATLTAAGH